MGRKARIIGFRRHRKNCQTPAVLGACFRKLAICIRMPHGSSRYRVWLRLRLLATIAIMSNFGDDALNAQTRKSKRSVALTFFGGALVVLAISGNVLGTATEWWQFVTCIVGVGVGAMLVYRGIVTLKAV